MLLQPRNRHPEDDGDTEGWTEEEWGNQDGATTTTDSRPGMSSNAEGRSRKVVLGVALAGAALLGGVLLLLSGGQEEPLSAAPEAVARPAAPVTPTAAASTDVAASTKATVRTAVSEENIREFAAQETVADLALLMMERSAEQGMDAYLDEIEPLMTADAFATLAEATRAWDWKDCAATNCQYSGTITLLTPDEYPPVEGDFNYRVVLQVYEGSGDNATYAGTTDMSIAMVEGPDGEYVASSVLTHVPTEGD